MKIVVESDSVVEYYLMIESIRHATRLGPNFLTYMNIFELYFFDIENQNYGEGKNQFEHLTCANDILNKLGLQKRSNEVESSEKCQTIVRIINKIAQNYKLRLKKSNNIPPSMPQPYRRRS